MSPAEFEQAQENLEQYLDRRIGKLTFTKRMTAFGFSIKTCQEFMAGADKRRVEKIGKK